jgi:hypothetical protein
MGSGHDVKIEKKSAAKELKDEVWKSATRRSLEEDYKVISPFRFFLSIGPRTIKRGSESLFGSSLLTACGCCSPTIPCAAAARPRSRAHGPHDRTSARPAHAHAASRLLPRCGDFDKINLFAKVLHKMTLQRNYITLLTLVCDAYASGATLHYVAPM